MFQQDTEGGSPQKLAGVEASTVLRTAASDLVFVAPNGELSLWQQASGKSIAMTKPSPGERHAAPSVFDGGKQLLYRVIGGKSPGWYVKNMGAPAEQPGRGPIALPEVGGLFEGRDKWWIYLEDRRLLARRIHEPEWQLAGPAITIADAASGFFWESNGILVVANLTYRASHAGWFDRTGRLLEPVVDGPSTIGFGGALSPDGKRLALPDESSKDLWITEVERKNRTRLTFERKETAQPVWSPDGTTIIFAQDRILHSKAANGSGQQSMVPGIEGQGYPTDWSRDGKFLLFYSFTNSRDVYILPMTGESRKPIALEASRFSEGAARFSPDGKWISYVSDESGRDEIYVRDNADGFGKARGKWLVSNGGGFWHRWRDDSKEIVYMSGAQVMSVDVDGTREAFSAANPKKLFEDPHVVSIAGMSKDGKRLLLLYSEKTAEDDHTATVIMNLESLLTGGGTEGR